jgi:quercetin dioxygenase-like cupin family protein
VGAMPREILRSTQTVEPDGTELNEEEWRLAPGWPVLSFESYRPGDVRLEILAGQARVRIGTSRRVYRAGESVIVTAGESHELEPVDSDVVRLLVQRWTRRTHPSSPSIEHTH